MSDYAAFKDFKYERFDYKTLIKMDCKIIENCCYNTRVYWDADPEKGSGFEALVLSCIQTRSPDDKWKVHPPFSENDGIIILVHAIAAFDGIRHAYIQFDETYEKYGYIHSLDPQEWISIFNELDWLRNEFCRDPM